MANTKYAKYIVKAPIETAERYSYPVLNFKDDKPWSDWRDIKYSMAYRYINKPTVMADEPHEHDFEQFLFFLGGDPTSIEDFGAEIELTLGREREIYIINTASVVRIPPGLYHGPFNFKIINKPILFLNAYLSPEYIRKA
jgi:hypothetical protein